MNLLPLFVGALLMVATTGTDAHPHQEGTLYATDHPLAGRILAVESSRYLTDQALFRLIEQADYVLIGETHDNPIHHDIQRNIIREMADWKGDASVSFEMIDALQGHILRGRKFESASTLIDALAQFDTGWQYERHYARLFDAVLDAGFGIRPANIDRKTLVGMMHDEGNVDPDVAALIRQVNFGDAAISSLRDEIAASHCHMLGDDMIDAMVYGQQVRDAVMALSLTGSSAARRILIAGNGHVRKDRGVPAYLRAVTGNADILVIGILEVYEDETDPREYSEAWGRDALPFDLVRFTPRMARSDPCEQMRKHMEQRSDP